MDFHRYTSAVVGYAHYTILMDSDLDLVTIAGHRFIYAIVNDLADKVMKPPLISAADIHAGAHAHRFDTAKYLNVFGSIVIVVLFHLSPSSELPMLLAWVQ